MPKQLNVKYPQLLISAVTLLKFLPDMLYLYIVPLSESILIPLVNGEQLRLYSFPVYPILCQLSNEGNEM